MEKESTLLKSIRLSFLFCLLSMILFGTISQAANHEKIEIGSHTWVVVNYFAQKEFSNLNNYISDKEKSSILSHPTFGESLSKPENASYHILQENDNSVIYSISLMEQGEHIDIYCYLSKYNNVWKIDAIRSLTETSKIKKMVNKLSKKSNLSESQKYIFENSRLILGSDENLKSYFQNNVSKIQNIVSSFENTESSKTVCHVTCKNPNDGCASSTENKIVNMLKELNFHSVEKNSNGSLSVVVGELNDAKVGFMYNISKNKIPRMSSDEYYYVEQIIPNWYIFKTN